MVEINKARESAELEFLSDQIAEVFFNWGFKRTHGKIWTHLLLSKIPLDAPSLVELLKISKALVSISLKELLEIGAIKVSGKSERGTKLYIATADVKAIVARVFRQRERRLLGRIKATQDHMAKIPEADREQMGISDQRLSELGSFLAKATVIIDKFIATPTDVND